MKKMILTLIAMAAIAMAEEFEMTGTLMGTTYLRVEGEKQINLGRPEELGGVIGDFKHGDKVHVKVEGKWNSKNPRIFLCSSVLSVTEAK